MGLLFLAIAPFWAIPSLHAQEPTAQNLDSGNSAAKMAQAEDIRRSQAAFAANKAINDGIVYLQAGDYIKADDQFQFVLKNIAPDGQTQALYNRASAGEAQVKLAQADEARKSSDFDHASSLLAEAVQYDPSVKPLADKEGERVREDRIREEKERVNPESIANNPVITPEFKDNVATVQKNLFDGDRYFETGQYDRADACYKQVLVIDPYNSAAREKLERLDRYKLRAADQAHETTRVEALYDIERRWSETEVADAQQGPASTEPAAESNVARLTNKLNSIRIDSVSFVGTPVDDAIRILAAKAKEADSTGEGINFVLKLRPNEPPPVAKSSVPPLPSKTGPAVVTAASAAPATVTLSLNDVSLAEVLRVLTQLTNLKYKVEEYAVFILPSTETSDVLIPRTFVVPTGFFQGGLTATAAAPVNGVNSLSTVGSVTSAQIDVKQQLMNQGVDFPPGSTAAFLSGSSRLVVKNTPDQLDRIDALLQAASQEEDPQVEIETKFTEFTDNQLKELVNNWALSFNVPGLSPLPTSSAGGIPRAEQTFVQQAAGQSGPIYGGQTALRGEGDVSQDSLDALLSNSGLNGAVSSDSIANFQIGAVIGGTGMTLLTTLIDEIHGVDLLSAPKVTTKNRAPAKVEIDEQMSYPSQFTAPTYNTNQVQFDNVAVTLIAPPTPSSFNKQAIGVTLDVTPVAYADRRIDLDLKPEVTDFDGFVDYGSTINQGSVDSTAITAVETYHVRQPVFNNRKITTKLQVIDGQTVIMGGLVREDTQVINDKVPVLGDLPMVGRLFQSKVDQKTKRNLIIFITARIIRSTGKPKYTPLDTAAPMVTADNSTHIGS